MFSGCGGVGVVWGEALLRLSGYHGVDFFLIEIKSVLVRFLKGVWV